MKVDAPLRVQVPAAGDDQPSWVRVGVIAAVGFAIGVGWPRLVGARLGPSLPAESSAAIAARAEVPSASSPVASPTPSSPLPVASGSPTPSPSGSAAAPGGMPALVVNHGILLSCKSDDGETLKGVGACGGLSGFDGIVQPRLRKLSSCPVATAATSGKLSVVFNLDFASKKVSAEVGKSSTVNDPQGFASCVKSAFQGVSLGALDHQNPRYTLAYNVQFTATDHVPAPSASPSGPADGIPASAVTPSAPSASSASTKPTDDSNVEVAWEVAIVRDSPRTGAVVARLPRGTKVRLGANQEGWFKIAYGSGEGWVYRGAIGR